jgi:hypothetical protein
LDTQTNLQTKEKNRINSYFYLYTKNEKQV